MHARTQQGVRSDRDTAGVEQHAVRVAVAAGGRMDVVAIVTEKRRRHRELRMRAEEFPNDIRSFRITVRRREFPAKRVRAFAVGSEFSVSRVIRLAGEHLRFFTVHAGSWLSVRRRVFLRQPGLRADSIGAGVAGFDSG